jgi:hypothetical protein
MQVLWKLAERSARMIVATDEPACNAQSGPLISVAAPLEDSVRISNVRPTN